MSEIKLVIEDQKLVLWLQGKEWNRIKDEVEVLDLSDKEIREELILYESNDYKIEYKGKLFDAYWDYGADECRIPLEFSISVLKDYIPLLKYLEESLVAEGDFDGVSGDKRWFLVYNDLTEEFGIVVVDYKKRTVRFAVDFVWKFPKKLYEEIKGRIYKKRPFRIMISPRDLIDLAMGLKTVYDVGLVLVIRLEKDKHDIMIVPVFEYGVRLEYEIWEVKRIVEGLNQQV